MKERERECVLEAIVLTNEWSAQKKIWMLVSSKQAADDSSAPLKQMDTQNSPISGAPLTDDIITQWSSLSFRC